MNHLNKLFRGIFQCLIQKLLLRSILYFLGIVIILSVRQFV